MKLLLLSILLVTPQLISSKIIIDLENEGREGSEHIKNLNWFTDKEIGQSTQKSGQNIMSEINNQVRFNVPTDTKQMAGSSFSTDVPTMKLTTIDEKGQQEINYSLSQSTSDECLMVNYPKTKIDSSVSCTYSNGYSVITKTFPNKHYKKEMSIGRYVIGLTQDGKFDIGIIQDNQVYFDNSYQSKFLKENFNQFEQMTIKDFFIVPNPIIESSSGNFWILTEDELILMGYSSATIRIDFDKTETFSIKEHNLNLTELKQVFSYFSKEHYLILNVGFYKLTKGTDRWEITRTEKLNLKGTEVELKNFEATLFRFRFCVAIKGYGLIIFQDMVNFKVFEHKQMLGLAPVKHTFDDNFILGVLIDNQSDVNVKEFLIEFTIDKNPTFSEFELNRVFISSQKIKSVKTDPQGLVTMFLTDSGSYIIPRNIYPGFSSLPVYVYKNAENSLSIEYINITDNVIMFSLADDKEEKVVTLYKKPEDSESFTCSFKKEGNFFAQITRHVLLVLGDKKQEVTSFPIKIVLDMDKEEKDKKDKEEKDKKDKEEKEKKDKEEKDKKDKEEKDKKDKEEKDKKDKDGQPTESSGNTVLIVVIVIISIVIVVGIIAVILYIRKKKKQSASGALIESGNYRLSA
jgi:hypothetical protein